MESLHIARVAEYVAPCPGGKEIHIDELGRREAAEGHDVELIFRNGAAPGGGVRSRRLHLPYPYRRQAWIPTTWLFCRAAGVVVARAPRVDVVHLHGDVIEAELGARLRGRGLPSVLTVHGAPSPRWIGRTARAACRLDRVICVSPGIRDALSAAGAPSDRLVVQSSGIDLARIDASTERGHALRLKMGDDPVVLFVGSLDPVKGIDVLIEAFRALRRMQPQARLVLAGAGPDDALLPADAAVRPLGRISRDEVYAWMHAADVLALPSRDLPGKGEGTPTVVMEALASGLPVVASDAGGAGELVFDPAGKIVPSGDAGALGEALAQVVQRGAPDARLRERMRGSVAERDWPLVVRKIDDILRTAATEPARVATP